jgi:excinuclease ABC subunit C
MHKKIQRILENIPVKTGIYKFYDNKKNVLYVGKALNLRARVNSYFRETHVDRPHILKMLPLIDDVETIVTENEVESLILESALIKKYKPKFNVELKDDKSFSWIYISTHEKFPKVKIVRSLKKGELKKGKLFGPYPKGKPIKRIFEYVRKLYPFCTCNNPKKACLYVHLGLCPNPYHGSISESAYMENINNVMKFLNGKKKNIVNQLKKEMQEYAQKKDFEKAAILRDKVNDLEYLSQKIYISPFESEIEYMQSKYEKANKLIKILENKLGLKKLQRIECFDISNIKGDFAYGSMSVAIEGRLKNEDYRIFKIRGEKQSDDTAMLSEVISRRIKNIGVNESDKSLFNKPDLIVLDGGIAQLSVIQKLLNGSIKLLAVSKGKRLKRAGGKQKDEFWVVVDSKLKKVSLPSPIIITELRDEAHRFALKHHRISRAKSAQLSELDEISGVGKKRRKMLLEYFGDVQNIKKASQEDLYKALKNKCVAKKVYIHFH